MTFTDDQRQASALPGRSLRRFRVVHAPTHCFKDRQKILSVGKPVTGRRKVFDRNLLLRKCQQHLNQHGLLMHREFSGR